MGKRHDVKWMKGAYGLVDRLSFNREYGGENLIGKDVIAVLENLNVSIANASLSYFNDLLYGKYSSSPLTGGDAYK